MFATRAAPLWILVLAACAGALPAARIAAAQPIPADAHAKAFATTDGLFADAVLDGNFPGLAYGVVVDGQLVHVTGYGVQDLDSRRPVTADTVFRIASMTKAFTALTVLTLRDRGALRTEAPAEEYVPEMRGWTYPTRDSPRVRVRDLLNHTAGFVTDDPWGDRQTPLPEAEFSRLLSEGIPFTRAPGTAMEYSNLGYALLGRIIGNVSGQPWAQTITQTLLEPLGMRASTFFVDDVAAERRALGYHWDEAEWTPEPTLQHGAFGAMGGLHTSVNDYAKWVAFLLSAWPARDDPDPGPVARATVRELAQGSNFPELGLPTPVDGEVASCPRAIAYGMGFDSVIDCRLGNYLAHGGGYPGYGSYVLLLPEHGVAVFAFANRRYAPLARTVYRAALALKEGGVLPERAAPVSRELADAYAAAGRIYTRGELRAGGDVLAMNFLMDRDAGGWKRDLAALKQQVGACDTGAAVTATGALSGSFSWRCASGRVRGSVLLAPTHPPRIQALSLERIEY